MTIETTVITNNASRDAHQLDGGAMPVMGLFLPSIFCLDESVDGLQKRQWRHPVFGLVRTKLRSKPETMCWWLPC